MPTESEMMADLAAADAAGDGQLAQHIAGQIKAARAPPSILESMGRGAAGPNTIAAMTALGERQAKDAVDNPPTFPGGADLASPSVEGLSGDFSKYRAEALAADKAAKDAHPGFHVLGNVLGAVPFMAVGGPAAGASKLARAVWLAKQGAFLGAREGLDRTAADTAGGVAADTAAGAGVGAVAAPVLDAGVGALARRLLPRAAEALEALGLKSAKKVLTGSSTLSTSKPLSDEAAQEALQSGAIRFGGTTTGAAQRLDALRETVGGQYGDIVQKLEQAGVKGPEAQELAAKLAQRGQEEAAQSLGSPAPGIFEKHAQELVTKLPEGESRLGLSQAENMKRTLQTAATNDYKRIGDTLAGDARKESAAMLRQAVEDEIAKSGEQNPALRELTDQFNPVKQRFAQLAEAGNAADVAAARASKNRGFGLTDTIMAAGGIAHGNPLLGGAAGIANKLLRERGGSSLAVGSTKIAEILRAIAEQPASSSALAQPGAMNAGELLKQLLQRAAPPLATQQLASQQ